MRKSFLSCPFFVFREDDGGREVVRQCGEGQYLVGGRFPDYCAQGRRSCPVAQFIRKMQQRGEPFYLWLRVGVDETEDATAPEVEEEIGGLSIESISIDELGID